MDKIKVGIVNYLNTKPLLYGLQLPPINEKIKLIGAYPARLVRMLLDNEIDVGLIPVAAIPELPSFHLAGNYCIGTEGETASVCLFSEVPMNEIEKVFLDYQSRSSIALLKWLMKESWGINPEIIETSDDSFRNKITGTTAGLVIGDRALEQRRISTFIYDLGAEWRAITGLPFVYAAWISIKKMSRDFVTEFDQANAVGLSHIDEIVTAEKFETYDLKKYYNLHLSYKLDERKQKALQLFLQVIS